MTTEAQARVMLRVMEAHRASNPAAIDQLAKAHLISFVAYWRLHHGSASVIKMLDGLVDAEIPKAMAGQ